LPGSLLKRGDVTFVHLSDRNDADHRPALRGRVGKSKPRGNRWEADHVQSVGIFRLSLFGKLQASEDQLPGPLRWFHTFRKCAGNVKTAGGECGADGRRGRTDLLGLGESRDQDDSLVTLAEQEQLVLQVGAEAIQTA
jgi:hypothetical protein